MGNTYHASMNFLNPRSLRVSTLRQNDTSRAGFGVAASAASVNRFVNLSARLSVCLSLSMNPSSRVMIALKSTGDTLASP